MAIGRVELGDFDLINRRRGDQKDLGLMGDDVGMIYDGCQVLLVLLKRHMLFRSRQVKHGIVGAKENHL